MYFYVLFCGGHWIQIPKKKQPNKTVTDLAILRNILLQKYKTCFLSNIVLIGNYCIFFPLCAQYHFPSFCDNLKKPAIYIILRT